MMDNIIARGYKAMFGAARYCHLCGRQLIIGDDDGHGNAVTPEEFQAEMHSVCLRNELVRRKALKSNNESRH